MTTYKIVSVTRSGEAPHDHVTSLSIGPNTDIPVETIREALDDFNTYYVFGGGLPAAVEKFDCECGAATIRSISSAIPENDLSTVPLS